MVISLFKELLALNCICDIRIEFRIRTIYDMQLYNANLQINMRIPRIDYID